MPTDKTSVTATSNIWGLDIVHKSHNTFGPNLIKLKHISQEEIK